MLVALGFGVTTPISIQFDIANRKKRKPNMLYSFGGVAAKKKEGKTFIGHFPTKKLCELLVGRDKKKKTKTHLTSKKCGR